jgi:hypothetical protein
VNLTSNDGLYNDLVFEFELYMLICIHVVVSFEYILFNFLLENTVGEVLD